MHPDSDIPDTSPWRHPIRWIVKRIAMYGFSRGWIS